MTGSGSVLIGVFIPPRAWQLGRQAVRILLQAAPPDLDIEPDAHGGCSEVAW